MNQGLENSELITMLVTRKAQSSLSNSQLFSDLQGTFLSHPVLTELWRRIWDPVPQARH